MKTFITANSSKPSKFQKKSGGFPTKRREDCHCYEDHKKEISPPFKSFFSFRTLCIQLRDETIQSSFKSVLLNKLATGNSHKCQELLLRSYIILRITHT